MITYEYNDRGRLKLMNYDYKCKQRDDGTWVVLDKDGFKVAGPFNTAIAAGGWARDRILRKTIRRWNEQQAAKQAEVTDGQIRAPGHDPGRS